MIICADETIFSFSQRRNNLTQKAVALFLLLPRENTSLGGRFSCLKTRMLEKFQPIKIAKRFYWLNAFLTKSKSVLAENVLNQWKIIKNIKNCGLQPQYYSDNHQD